MSIASGFERFFNFLANMGLVLRDDPPKVVDLTGREWGEAIQGLALSIREISREDSGQPVVVSTVIRNEGPKVKIFSAPGWLFFYEVHTDAPLSGYGRRLLQPERRTERIDVTLAPGDVKETDLPVGALYEMRAGHEYRMRVSCRLPDEIVLTSNEISVRV